MAKSKASKAQIKRWAEEENNPTRTRKKSRHSQVDSIQINSSSNNKSPADQPLGTSN
jgi:hypothetical protein